MKIINRNIFFFFLIYIIQIFCIPKVLIIQAHPDDESLLSGTLYKIAHDLQGIVDSIVITNGEGGYDTGIIGEWIYHKKLTNETIGRAFLPKIRKEEMIKAANILNFRNVYFLEEIDVGFTLDVDIVLKKWWNVSYIKDRIKTIIQRENYDIIFCFLPVSDTHGEHKAASVIGLEIVKEMLNYFNSSKVPIILGASATKNGYIPLSNYPITKAPESAQFFFDLKTPIKSLHNNLNYAIIVAWGITAHKSQGELQMRLLNNNSQLIEYFYYFDINPKENIKIAEELFKKIQLTPFRQFNSNCS
jgi:LmbE family N-acetylglucosaminyl deacetylase